VVGCRVIVTQTAELRSGPASARGFSTASMRRAKPKDPAPNADTISTARVNTQRGGVRERDASACIRRHQASAVAPVKSRVLRERRFRVYKEAPGFRPGPRTGQCHTHMRCCRSRVRNAHARGTAAVPTSTPPGAAAASAQHFKSRSPSSSCHGPVLPCTYKHLQLPALGSGGANYFTAPAGAHARATAPGTAHVARHVHEVRRKDAPPYSGPDALQKHNDCVRVPITMTKLQQNRGPPAIASGCST